MVGLDPGRGRRGGRRLVYLAHTSASVEDAMRKALPPDWDLDVIRDTEQFDATPKLEAADFVVVVNVPLPASAVFRLRNACLVVHQGVGYDSVDIAALRESEIPFCITPEGTTETVADHAIMLMLACSRYLLPIHEEVSFQGKWPKWQYRARAFGLQGTPVGLVGFGRIGQAVARRLFAMEAAVRVHVGEGRSVASDWMSCRVEVVENLSELFRGCRIVSLHLPLTSQTRGIVTLDLLQRMPSGSILVNTARGGLMADAALAQAVTDGPLVGAGLDVLEHEPPSRDNVLIGLPNVLVTPHLASGTQGSMEAKVASIVDNCTRAVEGKELRNQVL